MRNVSGQQDIAAARGQLGGTIAMRGLRKWFLRGHVLLVGLAVAVSALAGTDVRMNSDPPGGIQNEVSLTLNPATPGNVVTAYNDNVLSAANNGIGISYSTDYGASWTDTQSNVPTHPYFLGTPTPYDGQLMSNIFDPISGADTQGRVYAGYIANINGVGGPTGVYVEHSDDGGVTWTLPPLAPPDTPPSAGQFVQFNLDQNSVAPGTYRFNDKPHLTVDRWTGSPNTDNVYVTWIQDDGQNPQGNLLFSASTDQGMTWSSPIFINDNFSPRLDLTNGPNAAVAPDGTIYVAWLDVDVTVPGAKPANLMFDKSTNGGASFGTDINVFGTSIRTLPNNLQDDQGNQDARARGYPAIATSPTNSQDVYLVYAQDPDYVGPGSDGPDEADVFFIKSTNGGSSWTSPLRLNDDSMVTDQFAPWIAVKPNGTIDVAWYDKRNSPDLNGNLLPDDNVWDVYFASSTDGGNTFSSNLLVTDQSFATPFPPASSDPWIGEYLGLAVDSTHAYIGFTSGALDPTGSGDPTNGDVWFDRIANPTAQPFIPEPSTWLLLAVGGLMLLHARSRRRP